MKIYVVFEEDDFGINVIGAFENRALALDQLELSPHYILQETFLELDE